MIKTKVINLITMCMLACSIAYGGANPKDSTDTVDSNNGSTKGLVKPRTATITTASTIFPYILTYGTGYFYIGKGYPQSVSGSNRFQVLPATFEADIVTNTSRDPTTIEDISSFTAERGSENLNMPGYLGDSVGTTKLIRNTTNQVLVTALSKSCQPNFMMNAYFTIKDVTVFAYTFCYATATSPPRRFEDENPAAYADLPYDLSGYSQGTFRSINNICISFVDPNVQLDPQYYPLQYGNTGGANGVPEGKVLIGMRNIPLPNAIRVTQLAPTGKFVTTAAGATELYITPPANKPIALITTPSPAPIVAARPPWWNPNAYATVDVVSPVYNQLPYYQVFMKVTYAWEVRCEN